MVSPLSGCSMSGAISVKGQRVKPRSCQAGVGNGESGGLYPLVPVEQNVNINRPGTIRDGPLPSQRFLDVQR